MAYGAIELTTISRSQDYATIKHNEDNQVGVDQNNFSNQVQKAVEQNVREVHSGDDARWGQSRPDAKEKGNGLYSGDGGRNRKKKEQKDRMIVKKREGFDMKI